VNTERNIALAKILAILERQQAGGIPDSDTDKHAHDRDIVNTT
jgi:hypothetical protein